MAMIYDHSIQGFREDSMTHIQLQSMFGEAIRQQVMLTEYMFEDHMRDMKQHSTYIITPMYQRWNI